MTRPASAVRLRLFIGIFTAGTFVLFVALAQSPVPTWDDWDWLTWLLAAPISIDRLFLPHNEHFIPIPRLLYWLQYQLQGANGNLLVWMCLACQLGVGALFWREIARAWPRDRRMRSVALGGSFLGLFHAWQLHSIVLGASIVFPAVLFFAVAAITLTLTATGIARPAWLAASVLASLGAMLTTTSGIGVPVVVAGVAALSRAWTVAAAHALLAIVGAVAYVTLSPDGPPGAAGVSSAFSVAPLVLGFFAAFFAPFVTYVNVPAGVIAGAVLVLLGVAQSLALVSTWSRATRIERFAVGVIAFTLGSALMAAAGRAEPMGIHYASQSRYATYAMAYWAALLVMLLSVAGRGAALRPVHALAPVARPLAAVAVATLLGLHMFTGIIWIAKAGNLRAPGLAMAAGVQDDQWIRTIHSSVDAVYQARALAIARGDRTLLSPDLGRRIDTPPAQCQAAFWLVAAPEGPALRLIGTAQIDERSGWIVDAVGIIEGLAVRAPLVDQPDPSGGQVFAAVRQALGRGSLSTDRWIGFVPSTAALPLTFIAADGDRPVCQLRLSLVEKRQ